MGLSFDLSTSMNSSDQQRHLALSEAGIKQDIDSSDALGTFLLKKRGIKYIVQGQMVVKNPNNS